MNEPGRLLQAGSTKGYDWLVSTGRFDDVLRLCPDVVLGKYLAITSFDSGPLLPSELSEEEKSAGWTSQGGIAYSSPILQVNAVPQTYFSELYVFNGPANMGEIADPKGNIFVSGIEREKVITFVNYDFGLHVPDMPTLPRCFGNSSIGSELNRIWLRTTSSPL